MKFEATAYGPPWDAMEGTGITSKGVKLKAGQQKLVVAVDPTVIPYGTKLKIWPNPFGDRNLIFTASDTGGAFQGGVRKVDFFVASGRKDQNRWGRRGVSVKVVGRGSPTDVGLLGEKVQRTSGVRASKVSRAGVTRVDPALRQAALQQYLAQRSKPGSLLELAAGLESAQQVVPSEAVSSPAKTSSARTKGNGPTARSARAQGLSPLKELFWQGEGGVNAKNGQGVPQGFVSGHQDHVHVAAGPKSIVRLGKRAKDFGLNVSENSHFNGGRRITGGHATNSNHYSDQAIDVSGSPKQMRAYAQYIARLYGVNR